MKLPQKPQQIVNTTKKLLKDEQFKSYHRTNPKVVLRERQLTFNLVILLILQKTMTSGPLLLNEGFGQNDLDPATNSAGTKARRYLQQTAVIELNPRAIVAESSPAGTYQGYQGLRLSRVSVISYRWCQNSAPRQS